MTQLSDLADELEGLSWRAHRKPSEAKNCMVAIHARLPEILSALRRVDALLSPDAGGDQPPRPYSHAVPGIRYSETLGFDGGSLTIKTTGYDPNGSGWMCFEESGLEWERGENGKDYCILNLPNSELIAIRDKLCEVFPKTPPKGGE